MKMKTGFTCITLEAEPDDDLEIDEACQ